MDIVDAIVEGLKNLSNISLARLEKFEASLVRVDAKGSKFGLINCDEFTLQLILQEGIKPRREEIVSANFSMTVEEVPNLPGSGSGYCISNTPVVRNVSISSYFRFDDIDVTDDGFFSLGACTVHFVKNGESRNIDLLKGKWGLPILVSKKNLNVVPHPLTDVAQVGSSFKKEVGRLLRKRFPCVRQSPRFFVNGGRTCAVIKLKDGAAVELDSAVIKLSEDAFCATFAIVTMDDLGSKFRLRTDANIVAIHGG